MREVMLKRRRKLTTSLGKKKAIH